MFSDSVVNKITTPIINQIEQKVKDIPGWSPLDQLYTLFNLAYLTADMEGDIVEIGSWCGRSAVVLGMAAQLAGNTRVHCVDLFPAKDNWRRNADGSYSFLVEIDGITYGGYQDQTVWAEPFERDILPLYEKNHSLLEIFAQTVAEHQLQDVVVTHIGDSTRFVSSMAETFKCKLAFIDGDHGYKAVCRDIDNVERFLVAGGWICFDDAFASYDSVNRAIEESIINNPVYDMCQQMTRKCFIARKTAARHSG
jgi:predicted O-methyltransferase YrrM